MFYTLTQCFRHLFTRMEEILEDKHPDIYIFEDN